MSQVSVIIPAFNSGKYLLDTLTSVFNQTTPPNEIIVVDDGSTDNTAELVSGFSDKRLHYFYQKNSGVSAARNAGLRIATGEFITFLDADDRWHPRMIEQQKAAMLENQEIVLCFTNFVRFIDETEDLLSDQFQFYPELQKLKYKPLISNESFIINEDAFSALVSFGEIPGFTPCIIFRRKLIEGIFFQTSLRICEDLEFVLRAATRGKVAFNPSILLEVRRHSANATLDYSKIALNKIDALLSVQRNSVLKPEQQRALNGRLIRAYLDIATSLAKSSRLDAVHYYLQAIKVRGHFMYKLKGTVRMGLKYINIR